MRIHKVLKVEAPIQKTWEVLLDPAAMATCVPGVERVDVIDATHFALAVAVKVGIIRARFKLNVTVREMRPPHYLRTEVAGEESGLASSLRQTTELTLAEAGPDVTEVQAQTDVEVFGRLGTFGHSVIKAKADGMWDEFSANLRKQLQQP